LPVGLLERVASFFVSWPLFPNFTENGFISYRRKNKYQTKFTSIQEICSNLKNFDKFQMYLQICSENPWRKPVIPMGNIIIYQRRKKNLVQA
jgi:hypothetical protein